MDKCTVATVALYVTFSLVMLPLWRSTLIFQDQNLCHVRIQLISTCGYGLSGEKKSQLYAVTYSF